MTKKIKRSVSSGRSHQSSSYQLTLSWYTATYGNMTPITVFIYKLFLQYYQQLSRFSGTNYPPPFPAPSLVSQDLAFW